MIEVLTRFGLSDNDVKVYLILLENGPSSASEISERTAIHRRTIYDCIDSLKRVGLISFHTKGKRKLFEASNPNRFKEILQETKEDLNKLLPKLKQKKERIHKEAEAKVFIGKQGIITILEDLLRHREIWTFGSHGESKKILGPYFQIHHNKREQKKILSKFILSERLRGSQLVSSLRAEVRFLDSDYDSKIATIITKKTVSIITWYEEPVGVVLDSDDVADAFRNYFRIIWSTAKR